MSRSIQLRVEESLGDRIKAQSERKRISANSLIVDAIKLYLAAEKEKEWEAGFEAMGRDPDTVADAEHFFPLSAEAILGD